MLNMVQEATQLTKALSPVSQYFLPTSHQEIHPTHPVQAYVHHFQCKTLFAEKHNFPLVDAERRMTNLFLQFCETKLHRSSLHDYAPLQVHCQFPLSNQSIGQKNLSI